jgi:hypothetical protein
VKIRILGFVACYREGRFGQNHVLVGEYVRPKQRLESARIRRAHQFVPHDVHRRVVHFERREQGDDGLLLQRIGTPVAKEPTLGNKRNSRNCTGLWRIPVRTGEWAQSRRSAFRIDFLKAFRAD